MRSAGFKIGFCEDDIRRQKDLDVVYLDDSKKYPVPDIGRKEGFSSCWARDLDDKRLLIKNARENNPSMSGGIGGFIDGIKKLIIVGPGGNIPESIKRSDYKLMGVGNNLNCRLELDYYIFNNPNEVSLAWLPKKQTKWPLGIFGYGSYPEFVSSYNGIKFFYSSGWENMSSSLRLIDLIDPLSTCLHLSNLIGCEEILLTGAALRYEKERPGTVKIGNSFMYPQQILSLSLLSALVFWTARSGKSIFSLDIEEDWLHRKSLDTNI